MPLTEAAIRNAKPAAKARKLFDGGGLYLEVSPAGGKWWRLKYRIDGKEKRVSLGTYPEVGLRLARERRDEARRRVAQGIDPSAHRKAERTARAHRAANSFEVVAREWLTKHSPRWVASHADRIRRRLERDVFPWIGERPIAELTPPEILAVLRRIEGRGAIETAHRALANIGQVFRYGVATARLTSDPTRDLRGALSPTRPQHFAAVVDPEEVGRLLVTLDGYQGTPTVQAALRLAPLVFCRPGELRRARWQEIDLTGAEWRYTASKTRTPHVVPLSKQALAILRDLHRITGEGEFVFPSARSHRRPMSDNAILAAFRRLGISKEQMTGHGFRAMARTILDEVLGFRVDLIEAQLAHAVRDPNGRAYNRTSHLSERRRMMQAWAAHLDGLRNRASRK